MLVEGASCRGRCWLAAPGRVGFSELEVGAMTVKRIVNGVDTAELKRAIGDFQNDPSLARFKFRVTNKWIDGGHSRTTIKEFYGAGEEHRTDKEGHVLEADEPEVFLGADAAPNPVEHLLHALVTCLTGAMVYHAAARGIVIEELESSVEGDIDVQGFLGLKEDVRNGYQNIRITFRVKSDGAEEKLRECAFFSPVFDVVTNGTKVDVKIEKT